MINSHLLYQLSYRGSTRIGDCNSACLFTSTYRQTIVCFLIVNRENLLRNAGIKLSLGVLKLQQSPLKYIQATNLKAISQMQSSSLRKVLRTVWPHKPCLALRVLEKHSRLQMLSRSFRDQHSLWLQIKP